MEVSFCGFKNAGVQKHIMYDAFGRQKAQAMIFNCELTNDVNGEHLDSFEKVFKKSVNKQNPSFLNFEFFQYKKNLNTNNTIDKFFVNGKEYSISDKNLSVFEKIAKLFAMIIKTPDEKFKVNKDYLSSDDMFKNFIFGPYDIKDKELINIMHEPESVKTIAKDLLEVVTAAVDEYMTL